MPGRDIGGITVLEDTASFESARLPIAPLITGEWEGRAITGEDLRERLEGMSMPGVEFSQDGTSGWHTTFAGSDRYFRVRAGEDAPWTGAIPVGGGITGGGLSVGHNFPANPDTDSTFLFTSANANINAKDTDGTTDKTSAQALDLFRYDGTNWDYIAYIGGSTDVQFILAATPIPVGSENGQVLWFLADRTGLNGFVDTDGTTSVTTASNGDIFQLSNAVWIKRANLHTGGSGGGATPTQANIYDAVKAIFANPTNIHNRTVAADDANNELDLVPGTTLDAATDLPQANAQTVGRLAATRHGAIYLGYEFVTRATDTTGTNTAVPTSTSGATFRGAFSTDTAAGTHYPGATYYNIPHNQLRIARVYNGQDYWLGALAFNAFGVNSIFLFNRANATAALNAIDEYDSTMRYFYYDEQQGDVRELTNITIGSPSTTTYDWERLSPEQTKALLYPVIKEIFHPADQLAVTADDVNSELDITAGSHSSQPVTARGHLIATSSALPEGSITHGTFQTITWTVDSAAPAGFVPSSTNAYDLEAPHVKPSNQVLGLEAVAYVDGVETDSAFLPWGPGAIVDDTVNIDQLVAPLAFSDAVKIDIYYAQPNNGKPYLYLRGDGLAIPANATVRIYLAGLFALAVASPEVVFDNLDGTDSPDPTSTTLPSDYKDYSYISISNSVSTGAGDEIWCNTFPTALLGSQTGAVNRGRIAGTLDFTFNATTRQLAVTSAGLRYVVLYNGYGGGGAGGGTSFTPTQANLYNAVKAILVHAGSTGASADDAANEIDITGGGTTFTPSQTNLYDAVKDIFHPSDQAAVTADDANNEIDITSATTFAPTKQNIYNAVKAILVHTGSTGAAADDANNQVDITRFVPSQQNIYDAVKDILHPATQSAVTADDANHELDITDNDTTFTPSQQNLYDAVKAIIVHSASPGASADDAANEIDITGSVTNPVQTTAPASPATGQLWFDSSENEQKQWDGSAWQTFDYEEAAGSGVLAEVGNANVDVTVAGTAVDTTIDLSSYADTDVFVINVGGTGFQVRTPFWFAKTHLPVRAAGNNISSGTTVGIIAAGALIPTAATGNITLYFAITSAGNLLLSSTSITADPMPLTIYRFNPVGGSTGGGGTTFTPSQSNLYNSVKAILHPSDQTAVSADDTNNEIDITQFAPSKSNLYNAVKAIMHPDDQTAVSADDTNMEIDITGGSGTGAITVVTASNVTQTTGSPNTIEISLSPTPGSYTFGQMYLLETKETNTDEMIFKIAGLNNRPLVKANGDAMGSGDLTDERLILVAYNQDLGRFEVLNPFEVLNLETIENIEYNIQMIQNEIAHGSTAIGSILNNFIRGATLTAEVHDTTTDTQILPGSVFQFLKRYMPQGNAPRNISNEIAEQFSTALLTERLVLGGMDPDLRRFIIRAPIEYEAVPRVVIGGEFWWDDSQRTPQAITGFPNSTGSQLVNESGEFFYNIISLKKRSHATGAFPHRDPAQYWTTAIALKVGDDPYAGVPHYAGYSTGGQTVSTSVNTYLGTTNGSPEYDVAAGATESALVFDGLTQKSGGYNITFNVKVGEVETSVDFPMTGLTYNNDRAATSYTTSGTFRDETGEHTTSVPMNIAYNGTSHNFTVSITNNFAQAISVSAYYQRNIDLLEGTTSSNMRFLNYAYSNINPNDLTSADVSLTQGNWIKWILLLFEDSSTGRLWGKAAFRDDTTDYYNIPTLDFNYQNEEIDLSEFLLGGNVGMRHVQGYYLKTTIAEDSLPTHAQLGALLTADTDTSLVYGKVSETSETTVNIAERVNFTDIAINGDDFDPDDYVETTTLDDYATEAYADAQASVLEHWTPVGNPTGDIGELKIENGGTGYSGVLTVTITPDSRDTNAQDATASATRTGGAITNISLNRRGNGYTYPPTVTVAGSTGGSGAVISSTVRLPLGTPAVPMGNIDYRAWDSSNGRWNVNYQGRNPNRSPIYWRNPNIDWTRFGCNIDIEHEPVTSGNLNGALSFGWGFPDGETPGWSGAGSNGMALWFNRFHDSQQTDHGNIHGFFLINDETWANRLSLSRYFNYANNTTNILRHTVSGTYYTFHNGAEGVDTALNHASGNANNVFWHIPVKNDRYKMRIVGAGNKIFIYVNQILYIEITFPINMPTDMGPRFVMMGDSGQESGLRGYLYEIGVGAPDPADMMQGYTSGTLSNPFPTPIGDLWATSADFPTGEVLPTTLAWTVPTTAPTGIADGSGTYLNLPNVRPDHNNTKTQGLYVALYGDTDVLSDELFIPWGARIADDANEDGRYRLDHDTGYIALELDGTGLMMTTFSSPSSVLEGYYLQVRQWRIN